MGEGAKVAADEFCTVHARQQTRLARSALGEPLDPEGGVEGADEMAFPGVTGERLDPSLSVCETLQRRSFDCRKGIGILLRSEPNPIHEKEENATHEEEPGDESGGTSGPCWEDLPARVRGEVKGSEGTPWKLRARQKQTGAPVRRSDRFATITFRCSGDPSGSVAARNPKWESARGVMKEGEHVSVWRAPVRIVALPSDYF